MSSLFSRLTRYASNPLRDPREERLTEAFAATLQAAPAAACVLARGLELGAPALDAEVLVTTQRRTLVGDRVDIEVRYGPAVRPELVVWLELKWDAIPDAEQLARYALALEKLRYRRTALGLVAPRGAVVPEDAPGRHGTWNDVGRILEGWLRRAERADPDAHAVAIVGDFIDYLEEIGLAGVKALDVTDLLALNTFPTAAERMRQVVSVAAQALVERFSARLVDGEPKAEWHDRYHPLNFWMTYELSSEIWPSAFWLEFHAREDEDRLQARGEAVFGAGASVRSDDAVDEDEHSQWLFELAKLGFEYTESEDATYRYLFRYLYPAELLGGNDLEEQAVILARWVTTTFELLAARPPTRDPI